ncbi:MAG: ATP-dependent Clp protease ATP-binding subunit [Vicinamibacteria bacterium]
MSEPSAGLALAWRIAASEAGLCGSAKIECSHLMMGVLSLDKASVASLKQLGFDADRMSVVDAERTAINVLFESVSASPRDLRRKLRARLKGKSAIAKGLMSRSLASKAVFARAETLAGRTPVNSLHLLSMLLREPDPAIVDLLVDNQIGPELAPRVEVAATALFVPPVRPAPPASPAAAPKASTGASSRMKAVSGRTSKTQKILTVFARDLTAQAMAKEIGPIVGRRREVATVLQVLAQTNRFNPLLVGDAGVGKAAVVEAVAIRGVEGKDPAILGGKRILELDVTAFLTGTEYRGELEKRMKGLVDELRAENDILLFIGEIHRVVGVGRVGTDAANHLKTAILRGDLKVIGAVSIKDFREGIEKDKSLADRFERIDVPEPSVPEALEILRGQKPRIEKRHGVTLTDEAIDAAVHLSVRFDAEERLPHKALDLLAKAAAAVALKAEPGEIASTDARAVAEVLAAKRGLPVDLVFDGTGDSARLLKLEAHLKSKIVGQDKAVAKVAARIRLAHSGFASRRGPVATFLVLGPRGVGQTELARTLAQFLYGGPDALARFDMSDYSDESAVAKLIGSEANAIGLLTDAIRRKAEAVLLFDNVEKAHAKVSDLFIQLFDTGMITDGREQLVDGRGTIVMMTSHLGEADAVQAAFAAGETVPMTKGGRTKAGLRKLFRPEILNRVEEVIVFRPLDEADVRRIARPLLAQVVNRVRKTHGVFLRFEPEAEAFVVRSGFNEETGVTELQPAIERLIELPLAKLSVSGKLSRQPAWRATVEKGTLQFVPET